MFVAGLNCAALFVVVLAVVEYSHMALTLTYDQTFTHPFFRVLLNNRDNDVKDFFKNVAKVLALF